jgi:hypothetical protein
MIGDLDGRHGGIARQPRLYRRQPEWVSVIGKRSKKILDLRSGHRTTGSAPTRLDHCKTKNVDGKPTFESEEAGKDGRGEEDDLGENVGLLRAHKLDKQHFLYARGFLGSPND